MPVKPAILAIDDEPEVLSAVARDLRARYSSEYRILRANSGEEAIDALKELAEKGQPVALVLSDQRMPRLNGTQVLEQARLLHPDARRVLLTAYADTGAAIAAINSSQVHYYLVKPWNPPEEKLYPTLDDQLEDWKSHFKPGYDGLKIIGSRWSDKSHDLRDFLSRNQIPYQFLEIESAPAKEALEKLALENPQLPLVVLAEGEILQTPTVSDVAAKLGLSSEAQKPFYDLAIVGAGPAGLAAAVYGASEGLKTLLIEQEAPGGQAGTSSRIENYLGFPSGLSGADLARRALTQAQRFGVEVLTPQTVTGLRLEGPYRILTLEGGTEVACHVLMLSMGVAWNKLPAVGADALTGRGVYYGAAMSEATSCVNEHVYVVGAGNSAGQAALYFAEYATRVSVLVRGDSLEAKMSQYLVDRLLEHPHIEICLNTEVLECFGEDKLECVTLRDRKTGETRKEQTSMLFSFIGATPRTEWLGDLTARDAQGFLKVGRDLSKEELKDWPLGREPFALETSVPGVFAAGDVRSSSVKRVASAVGEGSVAVFSMHQHLASL